MSEISQCSKTSCNWNKTEGATRQEVKNMSPELGKEKKKHPKSSTAQEQDVVKQPIFDKYTVQMC